MTTQPLLDPLTVEDITVVKVHKDDIFPGIFEYIDKEPKQTGKSKRKPTQPPSEWPKDVWVIEYSSGEHGVIRVDSIHGLGAFRKKDQAVSFTKYVLNPPSRVWKAVKMSFEEAKALASSKPSPITAIILSGETNLIHTVK